MKKLKFSGKLKLKKSVISKLQNNQLLDLKGGQGVIQGAGCSRGPKCSCTMNTCGGTVVDN